MGCDSVRELAPEVALDIATGEERDVVLRHVGSCSDCRELLFELSSVGDSLLTVLATPRQPSSDFDARVLEALAPPPPPNERVLRMPWSRWAMAAGAVVVSAVLGAGVVYQATSADRQLGQAYRSTLEVGRGSSFAAAVITGPEGRVGTVFGYQGDPSWVMVTLDEPAEGEQTFNVRAATRNDGYLDVGEAVFEEGDRTWGERLPVDLLEVQEIQLLDSDGWVVFTAVVDAEDPWN